MQEVHPIGKEHFVLPPLRGVAGKRTPVCCTLAVINRAAPNNSCTSLPRLAAGGPRRNMLPRDQRLRLVRVHKTDDYVRNTRSAFPVGVGEM